MKKIALSQGLLALVDDEDYKRLSRYKWYAKKGVYTYYAARRNGSGNTPKTLMHRELLNAHLGELVDHADRNGLNNQKNNIRLCNTVENNRNTRLRNDNTSGLKGASFHKGTQRWVARINLNKKPVSLGYFKTAEEAALAYDKAACELFGDFASPNSDMGKVAFG